MFKFRWVRKEMTVSLEIAEVKRMLTGFIKKLNADR
jgi:hypothetical protein